MVQHLHRGDSDPLYHTARIKELLNETIEYSRSHTSAVNDARAQALLETTAAVLLGLRKAYEDFEMKNEPVVWKKAG